MLRSLVAAAHTDIFPLLAFKADPPSTAPWPEALPTSIEIARFYSICNGGYIGGFNWHPIEQLLSETLEAIDVGTGYYENGSDALCLARHVVLGRDAEGAPLIWDAETDLMATFYFAGGDWEPFDMVFDRFMSHLFTRDEQRDEMWAEALGQLQAWPGFFAS